MKKVLPIFKRYFVLLCVSSFLLLQAGCCANSQCCSKNKTTCQSACQKGCCQNKDANKKVCGTDCQKACCQNKDTDKKACGPDCQKDCCKK